MPLPPSVPPYYVLASAAIGGFVGAVGAISAQIVGHFLTRRRDEKRFRIESFERLRREHDADEELRRISQKDEPLTDSETERILGFFEEVGLYWERNLIDRELVDEILGDEIIDCFEDDAIMKYVGSVRGEERDPTYWEYFERLAREIIRLRDQRRRTNG
jgi:hypothetical protein